jgi:nucleotide-binding universal stress UspA family protein
MSDFPAKILVATDGSEDAMLASRAAIGLAKDTGAELPVVHVGPKHASHTTYLGYALGGDVCVWAGVRSRVRRIGAA